jgi:hypothetical protein
MGLNTSCVKFCTLTQDMLAQPVPEIMDGSLLKKMVGT